MPTPASRWSSADEVTPTELTERLRSTGVISADTSVASITHEPIGISTATLAALWRLHVRYDREGAGPRTIILKLPHASVEVQFLANVLRFYEREIGFYDNVAASTPIGTASCYWSTFDPATKDFVLLLEDLGALDCHDQVAGMPVADVRVVVRAVAAHHAHCWEREDLLRASWTGTVDEPPMPQAAEQMLTERIPILDDRLGSQLPAGTIAIAERIRDGVHPLLRALTAEGPLTLLHGDLRTQNLFFTPAPDRRLVAIDWQIAVIGRAAYDVGYLMAQSVTSEIRKAHEHEVLQEYHAALVSHGATGYSLDDAWDDYRRTILWSLIYPIGAISEEVTDPRALERIGIIATRIVHAIADLDATEMLTP